jgi:hypothetical protein
MHFRNLKAAEIAALEKQGCHCDDWSSITVSTSFKPDNIRQVRFEGKVCLGLLEGRVSTAAGLERPAGLYFSHLKDCEIHDRVSISGVGFLAGYVVESDVIIENAASIAVEGETTFGNGVVVEALNEGGGRELILFDRLSAQIAYLAVNYRHDPEMIARLESLIRRYIEGKKANRGLIRSGTCIRNAGVVRNVYFGPAAQVDGAQLLEEGSLASSREDPVRIGHGVIAGHFIALSGAHIDSGAILDKCFVGQGVRIGKQFSAENSVFFANCEGYHGEAVSLFAGPYTVTHHKSSLLIAGMFSFFNAGSASNQSNHMYKLGPVHQGILERGTKTGSSSYLLWPCRVGAFSVVMDKHSANFDTSEFPFSYITVEAGKSVLTPAMNLFTVGVKRDSEKWPARDRRKDVEMLDLVHFDLFNPYTVGKMIRAGEILQSLFEKTPKEQKYVAFKGVSIMRLLLKTCRKYYQIGLRKYYGDQLLKRLAGKSLPDLNAVRAAMRPKNESGIGPWIDLSGMFAPVQVISRITDELKSGRINDVTRLHSRLKAVFEDYEELAWAWYAQTIQQQLGIDPEHIAKEQLIALVREWGANSIKLNNMILKDAEKEFDVSSRIGFGIDGDEEVQKLDFASVRGSFEENSFVLKLKKENEEIEDKAAYWLSVFENFS